MNRREVKELIPVYLLGALDESERALLETHIRECPRCLALFHEQSQAATLLSSMGDSSQPSPELKQRVLGLLDTPATPQTRHVIMEGTKFLREELEEATGCYGRGLRGYITDRLELRHFVALDRDRGYEEERFSDLDGATSTTRVDAKGKRQAPESPGPGLHQRYPRDVYRHA